MVDSGYEFGAFRLLPTHHALFCGPRRVTLPPKCFEVLVLLVESEGRLRTKEELLRALWPDSFVEENNLSQQISMLRKALADCVGEAIYVETVPKVGYRLAVPVRQISTTAAEQVLLQRTSARVAVKEEEIVETESVEEIRTSATASPAARRPGTLVLLMMSVLVAASAAYWVSRRRQVTAAPAAPRSMAVLPLRNLRPDPDTDYLGIALADAVHGRLSYSSLIQLRPLATTLKYEGTNADPQAVGRQVQADTILTGAYLKDGDDLRVTAELVDVRSNTVKWKDEIRVRIEGLITVQDYVAQRMGGALHLDLRSGLGESREVDIPQKQRAYELYLKGRAMSLHRDYPGALKCYEESLNLDPDQESTLALLAREYVYFGAFESGGQDYVNKGLALYHKALKLNMGSPDVLTYSGVHFIELGWLEEGTSLLTRALRTNPGYAEAHWYLSQAYRYAGDLQKSLEEGELAERLDPSMRESSTFNTYLYLGEYQRFLATLPTTNNLSRTEFYRGLGYYSSGDTVHAAAAFKHAYELEPSLVHAQYGEAFRRAILGQRKEGLELMRRLEEQPQPDGEMRYKMAEAYAVLGDKEAGLRMLSRAIDAGFACAPYFERDPLLRELREDPRFGELLERARERQRKFQQSRFLDETES